MELTKTLRRIVLGVLALACALLIVVFIVLPLVGPFSSVAVPANCTI